MITIMYKLGDDTSVAHLSFEKQLPKEGFAAAVRGCQEVFERVYLTHSSIVTTEAMIKDTVEEPTPSKQTKKMKEEVKNESDDDRIGDVYQ